MEQKDVAKKLQVGMRVIYRHRLPMQYSHPFPHLPLWSECREGYIKEIAPSMKFIKVGPRNFDDDLDYGDQWHDVYGFQLEEELPSKA